MKLEEAIVYLLASAGHGMRTEQIARQGEPKCQNDTLKCTLEELAVINILKVNAKTKQEDIATQIGKSLRTVKRIMASLSEKGVITRENGKRNGVWVVKTDR